jgi:aspartate-semialdehyde dehydrogenase
MREMTSKHRRVAAIIGATGAVGCEVLRRLARRRFPLGELRSLASARSAGSTLRFKDHGIAVEALSETSFEGVAIAFCSAGSSVSQC